MTAVTSQQEPARNDSNRNMSAPLSHTNIPKKLIKATSDLMSEVDGRQIVNLIEANWEHSHPTMPDYMKWPRMGQPRGDSSQSWCDDTT
jgi:hypothetical protein